MDQADLPFETRAHRRFRRRCQSNAQAPSDPFLAQAQSEDLIERLSTVRRSFQRVLVLGPVPKEAMDLLRARLPQALLVCGQVGAGPCKQGHSLELDPEALPFKAASFDLVLSVMTLHWVNDLPGCLLQIRRLLQPDGLFLAAFPGGESLKELRQAFLAAEMTLRGGASPRVIPFIDLREAAGLLQRAGFALPVADLDSFPLRYREPLRLLTDLKAMGEASALRARVKHLTSPRLMAEVVRLLEQTRDAEGLCPITFDFITMTGWAPDDSQPQPLRPGSAKVRLADALGTAENPSGEKPN